MPKKKKMKKVSLNSVLNMAIRDKKFLNALMKNPIKALKTKGLTMSEKEKAYLIVRVDYARCLKKTKNIYELPLKGGKPCVWPCFNLLLKGRMICAWPPPK
jgi:hypothetical protein